MEIRRNDPLEGPQIIGFSGAGFRLRLGMEERPAAGAILLDPAAIYDWDAPAVDALQAADLGELLQLRPLPEFLLLGTGSQMIQPPRACCAPRNAGLSARCCRCNDIAQMRDQRIAIRFPGKTPGDPADRRPVRRLGQHL